MRQWFASRVSGAPAFGLLLLRIVFGLGVMLHGLPKIQKPFSWMGPESPVPPAMQGIATFTEFFGGLALIVGLLTPLAGFGVAAVLGFAAWYAGIRNGHPFVPGKPGDPSWELAGLYAVFGLFMAFAGGGQFSLDALLFKGKRR